jgi:hypothetical protein
MRVLISAGVKVGGALLAHLSLVPFCQHDHPVHSDVDSRCGVVGVHTSVIGSAAQTFSPESS